ncbi:MAG: putative molybdenum carrier protein [Desulfobacterales bacterium]
MNIKKIISGAQTGADRAALDFAINNDIPHGGWVPMGRKAEDGIIPAHYTVQEAPTAEYSRRTELNVREADGTLILSHGALTGGSLLTGKLTQKHHKPCLHIDFHQTPEFQATVDIIHWLGRTASIFSTLMVPGPVVIRKFMRPPRGFWKRSGILP